MTDYTVDERLPIWQVLIGNVTVAANMTHAQAREYADTLNHAWVWPMPNVGPLPPWWFRATSPPRISAEEREELSPDLRDAQRYRDTQRPYGKRKQQKWEGVR